MVCATVPEAAPAARNQRATSCPPPISAKLPKIEPSRLIASALACVSLAGRGSLIFPPPLWGPLHFVAWQPTQCLVARLSLDSSVRNATVPAPAPAHSTVSAPHPG